MRLRPWYEEKAFTSVCNVSFESNRVYSLICREKYSSDSPQTAVGKLLGIKHIHLFRYLNDNAFRT